MVVGEMYITYNNIIVEGPSYSVEPFVVPLLRVIFLAQVQLLSTVNILC
jgi:hypothetical protein